MEKIKAFKTGNTYSCRSLCDYDCIFDFEILSRTPKTVTIKNHNEIISRRIKVVDGIETIEPFGRFSMSPVLKAA